MSVWKCPDCLLRRHQFGSHDLNVAAGVLRLRRVRKLKETLATVQQLDKNMSNLRTWLSRVEAELARPVAYEVCHADEIQRKLSEQQVRPRLPFSPIRRSEISWKKTDANEQRAGGKHQPARAGNGCSEHRSAKR